jgi:hypothetical protein
MAEVVRRLGFAASSDDETDLVAAIVNAARDAGAEIVTTKRGAAMQNGASSEPHGFQDKASAAG